MWRDRRFLGVVALVLCGAIWYFSREKPANDVAETKRDIESAPSEKSPVSPAATAAPATPIPAEPQVATSASASGDDADKHAVIAQIRQSVVSDPKFAEELILEDQKRDPNSPDADERDALLVSALFNQRRMDEAKIEARHYYRRHPGGQYTDYLIRETHVRPPPLAVSP